MIREVLSEGLLSLGLERRSKRWVGQYYAKTLSEDCALILQDPVKKKGKCFIINPRLGFRSERVQSLYQKLTGRDDLYTCTSLYCTVFGFNEALWSIDQASHGREEAGLVLDAIEAFIAKFVNNPPGLETMAVLLESKKWGMQYVCKLPIIHFLLGDLESMYKTLKKGEDVSPSSDEVDRFYFSFMKMLNDSTSKLS